MGKRLSGPSARRRLPTGQSRGPDSPAVVAFVIPAEFIHQVQQDPKSGVRYRRNEGQQWRCCATWSSSSLDCDGPGPLGPPYSYGDRAHLRVAFRRHGGKDPDGFVSF